MEEILASIRRIISEDDQTPAQEPVVATHAAPTPEPEPAPAAVHVEPVFHQPEPDHEDVLELNEPVPVPRESHGDIDVFDPSKPAPATEPAAPAASTPFSAYEEPGPVGGGLISYHVASEAASHFGALEQTISMPTSGRTLEDVVRELMRPLLKDWLDQNLSPIVEKAVRDEVERISRRRV